MRGVIVLAGPKGAGKTSLAEAISASTLLPRISFGDAVRSIAQLKGLPTDTKALQDLGQSIVARNPAVLCEQVLKQTSNTNAEGLVIDGLRHKEVLDALKKLIAPRTVFVVFVELAPDEQARRLAIRDGLDVEAVRRMNLHAVEAQLPAIKFIADLVVDGIESPQANTARVVRASHFL